MSGDRSGGPAIAIVRALPLVVVVLLGTWPSAAAQCDRLHGLTSDGDIVRIRWDDPEDAVQSIATPPPGAGLADADGLAYDRVRERWLFAAQDPEGDGTVLHAYELRADRYERVGTLQASPAAATFLDAAYHYVPRESEELRRVDFADDGTTWHEVLVAAADVDGPFDVEGLAATASVLYGSTSSGSEDVAARFFSYDPAAGTFTTLSTAEGTYLQLAAVGPGRLYGASTVDGVFYRVDVSEEGEVTSETVPVQYEEGLSDLGGGPRCP